MTLPKTVASFISAHNGLKSALAKAWLAFQCVFGATIDHAGSVTIWLAYWRFIFDSTPFLAPNILMTISILLV